MLGKLFKPAWQSEERLKCTKALESLKKESTLVKACLFHYKNENYFNIVFPKISQNENLELCAQKYLDHHCHTAYSRFIEEIFGVVFESLSEHNLLENVLQNLEVKTDASLTHFIEFCHHFFDTAQTPLPNLNQAKHPEIFILGKLLQKEIPSYAEFNKCHTETLKYWFQQKQLSKELKLRFNELPKRLQKVFLSTDLPSDYIKQIVLEGAEIGIEHLSIESLMDIFPNVKNQLRPKLLKSIKRILKGKKVIPDYIEQFAVSNFEDSFSVAEADALISLMNQDHKAHYSEILLKRKNEFQAKQVRSEFNNALQNFSAENDLSKKHKLLDKIQLEYSNFPWALDTIKPQVQELDKLLIQKIESIQDKVSDKIQWIRLVSPQNPAKNQIYTELISSWFAKHRNDSNRDLPKWILKLLKDLQSSFIITHLEKSDTIATMLTFNLPSSYKENFVEFMPINQIEEIYLSKRSFIQKYNFVYSLSGDNAIAMHKMLKEEFPDWKNRYKKYQDKIQDEIGEQDMWKKAEEAWNNMD